MGSELELQAPKVVRARAENVIEDFRYMSSVQSKAGPNRNYKAVKCHSGTNPFSGLFPRATYRGML